MIEYNPIGRTITYKAQTSELSNRDKVNLFLDLMEDLGIKNLLLTNERCQEAIDVINKVVLTILNEK
jgi:hypothetical protein